VREEAVDTLATRRLERPFEFIRTSDLQQAELKPKGGGRRQGLEDPGVLVGGIE
jgi:hypothetical protein